MYCAIGQATKIQAPRFNLFFSQEEIFRWIGREAFPTEERFRFEGDAAKELAIRVTDDGLKLQRYFGGQVGLMTRPYAFLQISQRKINAYDGAVSRRLLSHASFDAERTLRIVLPVEFHGNGSGYAMRRSRKHVTPAEDQIERLMNISKKFNVSFKEAAELLRVAQSVGK
jgi:hypothetical protein